MSERDHCLLLRRLLAAKSGEDVRRILVDLGDTPGAQINEPFGDGGYEWHPFGNRLSNISTIGLATKPGRSLTERITNAIDAVLEDRVSPGMPLPTSSRAAAQQWFGRPMSGPSEGLFNWPLGDSNYDRRIAVVIQNSGVEGAPTVDVVDQGVGLAPLQFPSTILSLQEGNKITKRYLIGAFGQGGASTLAFSDFVLIVSRHKSDPNTVGFTVIREVNLDDELYKEDAYGYLCLAGSNGSAIPTCTLGLESVPIYHGVETSALPVLGQGTLVRHFNFKLTNLDKTLSPSPGNLYHFLHCSLFDPLFPFRLIDLRDPTRGRDERVTGSRNRLMRRVKEQVEDDLESRVTMRHYCPMEYYVPVGSDKASIGIEYWVVLGYRQGPGDNSGNLRLRSQSNEMFVQPGHPIIATLNGQNQGELSSHLLREINLGMVARHMVVHIDGTNADPRIRRELFATSREGLKDGPVLEGLLRVLRRMLEDDEELYKIEKELTDKLAQSQTATTDQEVKRQVSRLLKEAGYRVKQEGPTVERGPGGERQGVPRPRRNPPRLASPLPTLPYPEVTRFEIVYPKPEMRIHLNDNEVLLAETDADSRFFHENRIAIRFEQDLLEQASISPLCGGRIRWRLRPNKKATEGATGKIIVTLTRPDGTQMTDTTGFSVLPERLETTKRAMGEVPPFEIIAISPEDEVWGTVWPELSENTDMDKQCAVAYKPIDVHGGVNVYYSKIFRPFRVEIDRLRLANASLADLFRVNFEVWIAYHAILQAQQGRTGSDPSIPEETREKMEEEENIRVATMQVKQALKTAELMNQIVHLQGSSGEGG